MLISSILISTLLIEICAAANILALFPLRFKSHFILFDSLMVELTRRGHNVTVVNSYPKSQPMQNFHDVDVSACWEFDDDEIFTLDIVYGYRNPLFQIPFLTGQSYLLEAALKCPTFIEFLSKNNTFDLLITEIFVSDLMVALTKKFENTPFISFCAGPLFPWGSHRLGNPDNPAYIPYPHSNRPLGLRSTFEERLYNTLLYLFAKMMYSYQSFTDSDKVAADVFGIIPPISEIIKNTSLIFTFTHFTTDVPKPLVPNVVEIGGLHIRKPSPLPLNIEKFINESQHGVIYFCLGSLLRSETMPVEKRDAFVQVFSKLPQRVLWKWGDDHLPGKTDNIFISKWMPQRDILAHPNVKLFIAHGGALGINEAVIEGVPVLGIPMFGDQNLNLKLIQDRGGAEILHYTDITEEAIMNKVTMMLNDTSYSENMKRISTQYKDRPMSPMDTAVYWIEYVIRHKGAPHLRSKAADLPLYQYLLLDVFAFLFISCTVVLFVIYSIIKKSIRFFLQYYKKKTD